MVYRETGQWMRYFDGLKETVQMVANVATAVAFVLGILAIPFPPIGAAATIAGIIATIAHTVTAALRLVSLGAVTRVMDKATDAGQMALRAYRYRDAAGLGVNLIGGLFGGLGGAFAGTSGTNLFAAAAGKNASDSAANAAGAGLGEFGNRAQDILAGAVEGHAEQKDAKSKRLDGQVPLEEMLAMDDTFDAMGRGTGQGNLEEMMAMGDSLDEPLSLGAQTGAEVTAAVNAAMLVDEARSMADVLFASATERRAQVPDDLVEVLDEARNGIEEVEAGSQEMQDKVDQVNEAELGDGTGEDVEDLDKADDAAQDQLGVTASLYVDGDTPEPAEEETAQAKADSRSPVQFGLLDKAKRFLLSGKRRAANILAKVKGKLVSASLRILGVEEPAAGLKKNLPLVKLDGIELETSADDLVKQAEEIKKQQDEISKAGE